jgi:hypothetical protein
MHDVIVILLGDPTFVYIIPEHAQPGIDRASVHFMHSFSFVLPMPPQDNYGKKKQAN